MISGDSPLDNYTNKVRDLMKIADGYILPWSAMEPLVPINAVGVAHIRACLSLIDLSSRSHDLVPHTRVQVLFKVEGSFYYSVQGMHSYFKIS